MKLVELEITQTFKVQVAVDSKGLSDKEIIKKAADKADNMSHDSWGYEDTEFEEVNMWDIPKNFTKDHITLLDYGYTVAKLKKYSREDAISELQALGSL